MEKTAKPGSGRPWPDFETSAAVRAASEGEDWREAKVGDETAEKGFSSDGLRGNRVVGVGARRVHGFG